jgi:hypothetical protein
VSTVNYLNLSIVKEHSPGFVNSKVLLNVKALIKTKTEFGTVTSINIVLETPAPAVFVFYSRT